jgi:hypothetical protein
LLSSAEALLINGEPTFIELLFGRDQVEDDPGVGAK